MNLKKDGIESVAKSNNMKHLMLNLLMQVVYMKPNQLMENLHDYFKVKIQG
jgi:hypothetical protein